jgi:cyanate lyase
MSAGMLSLHKGVKDAAAIAGDMTREELTLKIQTRKRTKKLTWKQIAAAVGPGSPIVTTAAFLGQMRLDDDEAAKAAALLELSDEERSLLTEVPYRGSLPPGPPTDPLIYRFHELVQVYGTTLKALIQEEFGDGIMSAIDFKMQLEREPDPNGDRVKITMSGKFLPYKKY